MARDKNKITRKDVFIPSTSTRNLRDGDKVQIVGKGGETLKSIKYKDFVEEVKSKLPTADLGEFSLFNFNYEDLQPNDTSTGILEIADISAGDYIVEVYLKTVAEAEGTTISSISIKVPANGDKLNIDYSLGTPTTSSLLSILEQKEMYVEINVNFNDTINDLTAGEWSVYYRITPITVV